MIGNNLNCKIKAFRDKIPQILRDFVEEIILTIVTDDLGTGKEAANFKTIEKVTRSVRY